MRETVLALSGKFWEGMLYADEAAMREVADPDCCFVHIGMNADLDHEIKAFTRKIFQPTDITIHNQEVKEFGDVAICLTDVDYGLLLGGNPTTHHFMVTEVYQKQADTVKLIQFTFTALVH